MSKPANPRLSTYWVCLFPFMLIIALWISRPFQSCLGEAHARTSHLSKQERRNIALACRKLDGCLVKPGDTLSFNNVVGPRTNDRGFVSAPSYMGSGTAATEGGGICLVSSLLYKSVLQSNLKVLERTPHSRTISSVPPGLDATVWYGRYDLKFQNTRKEPVKLRIISDSSGVSVRVMGTGENDVRTEIVRHEQSASASQVAVTVFLKRGEQLQSISKDLYDRHLHN